MAIITGTLLAATKLLGGALSKKAKTPDAKKFVNSKVVDGGGKPGAIVKSETVSVTPTSPMVGSGVASTSLKPTKVSKPIGKVSFSSITNQLDSIVALTSMIDTVTQKQTEGKRRASELVRREKEKEKKKDREEKSESGSGALGFLGGKAVEAGNKFGIFNFLSNILLGIGALSLINLTKKVDKGFDKVDGKVGGKSGGITTGFKLFGLTIAAVAKEFPTILTKTKNLFSKIKFGDKLKRVGTSLKNVFKSLGNKLIPGFIKKSVKAIGDTLRAAGNLGRAGLEAARRGLTFDTRTKVPTTTNKGLNRLLGSGTGTKSIGLNKAVQSIRAKHGDEAARMYQGMVDNGVKPQRALQNVNKAISSGKLTSQPLTGLARQGGGSQLIKGGVKQTLKRTSLKLLGKGMTKFLGRVPIIGSLLVGIFTLLEDEDGDGKPDFNLAKGVLAGIGAGIGGAIGTGIMPVVGTVIGELIGEYIGKLFYTAISGGGLEAIKKQLANDIKTALTAGQVALGWIGDGFKRMYEAIPKVKLPDLGWANAAVYGPTNLLLGATTGMKIQDIEMPNPFWFIDPRTAGDKFSMISKAFFTRDSMKSGDVKESGKVEVESTEDKSTAGTGGANLETTRVMGKPVLTSAYGKMRSGGPHGGTDIAADLGAPLVPVTDATIVDYGKLSLTGAKRGDPSGWGNFIVYKDSQGYYHLYGHVLESGMKTGGSVKKGVPIAKVGSTGRSSGPHLHWEMGTSWSGGTLGGKMDPLSVYKVEDPFTVGGGMSDNSSTRVIKKPTIPEPNREDFGSGRSGAKKYEKALASYRSEMQSQPEISPQSSPSASVSGVESQASYEQTGGGSTVVLAAPPQQSLGGGGSSGGGSVMRVGSGDVLNSYYRAQLLGFLYKQG